MKVMKPKREKNLTRDVRANDLDAVFCRALGVKATCKLCGIHLEILYRMLRLGLKMGAQP